MTHATLFRLSNKIVQVHFKDSTEILLNSALGYVSYINRLGERTLMPFNAALESSDTEMTKRLRYAKDILQTMFNSGVPPREPESAGLRRCGHL